MVNILHALSLILLYQPQLLLLFLAVLVPHQVDVPAAAGKAQAVTPFVTGGFHDD